MGPPALFLYKSDEKHLFFSFLLVLKTIACVQKKEIKICLYKKIWIIIISEKSYYSNQHTIIKKRNS